MAREVAVSSTRIGSIDIAYNTLGRASDPPVVLIAGLSVQLIGWDDEFCQELISRDLYVIRFDNRDVGLSSHLDDGREPDSSTVVSDLPYTLADMAADTAGLIVNLGLQSAHLVGSSMGGMIAQIVAINYPERVRSLTSIMSTTGSDRVGQPTEAALAVLMQPTVGTREAAERDEVLFHRTCGSPGYPTADAELRDRAGRAFDRAFHPEGVDRQLAAAMTTPDRTQDLRRIDIPTLVIHGREDTLIAVDGGYATAEAIPGAELVVFDGMGHDLPRSLWPVVADHISRLISRAEHRAGHEAARVRPDRADRTV